MWIQNFQERVWTAVFRQLQIFKASQMWGYGRGSGELVGNGLGSASVWSNLWMWGLGSMVQESRSRVRFRPFNNFDKLSSLPLPLLAPTSIHVPIPFYNCSVYSIMWAPASLCTSPSPTCGGPALSAWSSDQQPNRSVGAKFSVIVESLLETVRSLDHEEFFCDYIYMPIFVTSSFIWPHV